MDICPDVAFTLDVECPCCQHKTVVSVALNGARFDMLSVRALTVVRRFERMFATGDSQEISQKDLLAVRDYVEASAFRYARTRAPTGKEIPWPE